MPAGRSTDPDRTLAPNALAAPEAVELRALAPLCLTAFVALLFVGALSPFLAVIAADLGTSVGVLGLAGTASLLMTAAGGLLIGPLSDHFGHRRAIVTGLALLTISALAGALAPAFVVFLLARMVGGLGFSATSGVTSAVAAARYAGDTRRRALGILSTTSILAGIIGAPVLTSIGALTSWRGAFGFVAVVAAVSAVAARWSIPPDPAPGAERLSVSRIVAGYRPLLARRGMLQLYAATAWQMFCLIGALTYAGAFLIEELHFSLRQVGWAFMVQSAGGFLGGVLASGRATRLALRPLYMAAMLVLGALFVAIYVLPTGGLLTVVLLGLTGLAQVIGWVTLAALLAAETPIGQGTTMVLNGSVLGVGGALGTASGGVLLGLGGYGALGILFPAAAVLSAALVWPLRR
jgi:predicted MFS family arabinose efflux permease